MTRGVFNWTFDDVVRFLKAHGFTLTHVKGSHYFYAGRYAGQFRQVSIPFHGKTVLVPRTMKSIITQSGIPKNLWIY